MRVAFLSCVGILMLGCASQSFDARSLFRPTPWVSKTLPEFDGVPHGEVHFVTGEKKLEKFIQDQPKMVDKNDLFLGWLMFKGGELTPGKAREIVANCGGDRYIAVTAADTKGYVNIVWIRASPARQRELLTLNSINSALPNALNDSVGENQKHKSENLLLNETMF